MQSTAPIGASDSSPEAGPLTALAAQLALAPELRRSEQLVRLLHYLCANADAHRPDALTEAAIGESVFGRQNFDPATDTIVRVHIRRLRQKLERHYQSEAASGPLLEIPKNSYTPRLVERLVERPAAPTLDPATPHHSPAASRTPFWRGVAVGFALCLVLGLGAAFAYRAFYPLWTGAQTAHPAALHPFWRPFTASAQPAQVAVIGPFFIRSLHGIHHLFRVFSLDQLPLASQTLGDGPLWPTQDPWLTMSSFEAIDELKPLLTAGGAPAPLLLHGQRLTEERLRAHATIALGRADQSPAVAAALSDLNFYSPSLEEMKNPHGFRNRQPAPGEKSFYAPEGTDELQQVTENRADYCLVTWRANPATRPLLSVYGNRPRTAAFVLRKLLQPAFLQASFTRAQVDWPNTQTLQLVFHVPYANGEPADARLLASRRNNR